MFWIQEVQGSVQSLSHQLDSPLLASVAHWTPNIRSTKVLSKITWLRSILKQEALLCIICKKMVGNEMKHSHYLKLKTAARATLFMLLKTYLQGWCLWPAWESSRKDVWNGQVLKAKTFRNQILRSTHWLLGFYFPCWEGLNHLLGWGFPYILK